MLHENIENETTSNIVKTVNKSTKSGTGFSTPQSTVRPNSSKSTSKSIATPRNLFSPSQNISGREAARLAKQQSTAERIKKVSSLKEKWAKEREIHAQVNKEKRAVELKKLQDETDAASAARKRAIDAERTYELLEKQREKELLSASLEERKQLALDLEHQAKAKRRISIFINSKMRSASLKKENELKSQKQQEIVTELADRRTDFLQLRQAKAAEKQQRRESMANRTLTAQQQRDAEAAMAKQVAEEKAALLETRHLNWEDDKKAKARAEQARRESMANRTLTAQQQREAEEDMAKQVAEEEAALLETRHLNWEDDKKAKRTLEEQRRLSVAGRLDHWREQKQVTQAELSASQNLERDFLKSRQLDHQDVQQYKKAQTLRDRKSLAGRLQKWREERVDPGIKAMAESVERELQLQAHEDVKNYNLKLEHERRESLAFRLEKARKDRTFEAGQHALSHIIEEEERKLQEYDRQDVKNYRTRLLEDRRRSMQYRNEIESRERRRQQAEKEQEKLMTTEELSRKTADWRDVKAYQAAQREAERRSLAGRIAESHRQKELDLQQHREVMDALHMDFELRRLDHLEMREYREEEKVRSRRSIALRLASWKDDKLRREKERAMEELTHQEEAVQREQDREELQAAKLALDMMERHNLLTSEMKK